MVCEESLPDGLWQDAARVLSSLPAAPALVVIGDDQALAQEVQALGGFDALIRPCHAWMKRREDGGNGVPKCSRA